MRRYRSDVPDALAGALSRALDRSPSNRFDSARQLASAVLDAVGSVHLRPWTQGEISDYVRTKFASDLERRSLQVAAAIQRGEAPAIGRTPTPPSVSPEQDVPETVDDDNDDGFPSVDTSLDEAPVAGPVSAEFQSSTPPPFSSPGDSSTSGQVLQSLQPVSPPPPARTAPAVPPRRSLLWPIVAGAMVLVAAGALGLVYKQMQQQPPQVVINSSPRGPDVVIPGAAVPGAVVDAGVGSRPAAVAIDAAVAVAVPPDHAPFPPHPTPHPPSSQSPYDRVLAAQSGPINQCMADHPDPVVPVSAQVHIATDGHTKTVALRPDGANGSPLGACIRNILSAVKWPAAPEERDLVVPFKARAT